MTDEEIEAAKAVKRAEIKAYINDTDSVRSLKTIQILLSAVIDNAGSLTRLTELNAALDTLVGPPS